MVRLLAGVVADQVDGHVVRGAERGGELYVRVEANDATRSNGTWRWYTTTACPRSSIPDDLPGRSVACTRPA